MPRVRYPSPPTPPSSPETRDLNRNEPDVAFNALHPIAPVDHDTRRRTLLGTLFPLLGTLFLFMLSVLILSLRPFDRTSDARRVHTQMPGDLCGRKAKLFPAPAGNPCPRRAHLPPLASP